MEEGTGRRWAGTPAGNPTRCRRHPDSDPQPQAAGNIQAAALNTAGGKMPRMMSRKSRSTEAGMSAGAAGAEASDVGRAMEEDPGSTMEIARTRPGVDYGKS